MDPEPVPVAQPAHGGRMLLRRLEYLVARSVLAGVLVRVAREAGLRDALDSRPHAVLDGRGG
ncbi:hypothetical protein OHB00_04520 [Streptomyces sp. NBC_00631]|uniref:hypothetical protein n=1 Tax=Streptomyces sp. NBC_00631 TaxID=2975793 RepID=UPI0030E45C34